MEALDRVDVIRLSVATSMEKLRVDSLFRQPYPMSALPNLAWDLQHPEIVGTQAIIDGNLQNVEKLRRDAQQLSQEQVDLPSTASSSTRLEKKSKHGQLPQLQQELQVERLIAANTIITEAANSLQSLAALVVDLVTSHLNNAR
mmetsp:Transcript_20722/g.34698  ORF Transcript_20722/g.34698 Transcript_20722/m.34698 type:complete len:144 (+) Transcript_20722:62-493(+)